MHTKHPETDPTKNYDTTDLPIDGILKGMVGLFAMAILAVPISYFLVMKPMGGPTGRLFLGGEPDRQTTDFVPPKPLAAPHPTLQDNTTALTDIRNMRLKDSRLLDSSYNNETTKEQTMPISDAIDLEAASGGR